MIHFQSGSSKVFLLVEKDTKDISIKFFRCLVSL